MLSEQCVEMGLSTGHSGAHFTYAVVKFLMVITSEMPIRYCKGEDDGNLSRHCRRYWIALFRKNRPHLKLAPQSGQDQVCDKAAIAASRT